MGGDVRRPFYGTQGPPAVPRTAVQGITADVQQGTRPLVQVVAAPDVFFVGQIGLKFDPVPAGYVWQITRMNIRCQGLQLGVDTANCLIYAVPPGVKDPGAFLRPDDWLIEETDSAVANSWEPNFSPLFIPEGNVLAFDFQRTPLGVGTMPRVVVRLEYFPVPTSTGGA